jgi:hypothetical protein
VIAIKPEVGHAHVTGLEETCLLQIFSGEPELDTEQWPFARPSLRCGRKDKKLSFPIFRADAMNIAN